MKLFSSAGSPSPHRVQSKRDFAECAISNWRSQPALVCIFVGFLPISVYGTSDLLSHLYAASRAQVTFVPIIQFGLDTQGFL
jgi:hypothetical protein